RDLFGLGAAVQALTGYDALASRAANEWSHTVGGVASLGLSFASGTVAAHELVHRTWSKVDPVVGRWLLAMTADASFAIEHVYGHHKHVGTRRDPATARRGENAYAFVVRSTVMSYVSAWNIERARLAARGYSVWSWRSRIHRGNAMTLAYAFLFFWAASWSGVLWFAVTALYGKAYLEFVNYIEHYGLIRAPEQAVKPWHSWNCNRRMSTWLTYNLPRHSHHHAMGQKPFYELRAYPDAPDLPFGYLTMVAIATVPPLFNWIMIPRVLEWDEKYAGDAERPYIDEANRESGMAVFEQQSRPALAH
ncbi:MAG: alkane 1-monooxygenase, partial [Myxococcota bacterium]